MRLLVYGADTHRSRRTLVKLEAKFRADRDASGINVVRLAAPATEDGAVAEALFATPFLAEKKLVVLEGFLREPVERQRSLVELLQRKPASTTVIFFEEHGADELAKSPLYAELKDAPYSTEHAPFAPAQAAQQVRALCAEHGVAIDALAVQAFLAAVGTESWRRETELAKLCAYAAATGAGISERMVAELVAGADEEDVFAFLDACAAGDQRGVTERLEGLLAGGMAEVQVVAMLTKHFRNLIAVRDCVDRGIMDKNVVAKAVGMHPFPTGKAMRTCARFSPERLRALHAALLDIEAALKSGSGREGAALLDVFAAKLAV